MLQTVSLYAPSVMRAHAGLILAPLGPRPAEPLVLYEFEGCPFCRKVREGLCMLDLVVDVRPCPKGGTRFRPEAARRSGKEQFPFLIDPNPAEGPLELLESADILRHVFRSYGQGRVPLVLRTPLASATSSIATALRPRGIRVRPSRAPAEPLELVGFEASPWCRRVREVLCELELPYRLTNVAKRSPSRPAFVAREGAGKMLVPWLHDPNTGASMYESADIAAYLEATYAL